MRSKIVLHLVLGGFHFETKPWTRSCTGKPACCADHTLPTSFLQTSQLNTRLHVVFITKTFLNYLLFLGHVHTRGKSAQMFERKPCQRKAIEYRASNEVSLVDFGLYSCGTDDTQLDYRLP